MKKKSFLIPVAFAAAALTGIVEANSLTDPYTPNNFINQNINKDSLTKDLLMLPNENNLKKEQLFAGHSSHYSHASHGSHSSHYSSR
tara:strand:- start:98 stop:358 length:261 start_codon:yes stop_codon:yes gene_type:complete